MRARVAGMTLWVVAFVAIVAGAAPVVVAADPTFGQPSATTSLGQPLTFTSQIEGVGDGQVEVLVGLAGSEPRVVLSATPTGAGSQWQATHEVDVAGSIECTCVFEGNSAPNTRIEYQFRVRAPDGTATLGPVGQITVEDDRFQWRTLEQDLVRVHWYEGDEAFAQAAADVANQAIDRAAELMGSTLPEPVDLFVYATQEALLQAVAPTRDNIAGQAHSTIGTMFVWLPPNQDPARAEVIVAHELTHLVFNEATDNLYHGPPRWLNEGIAVYLSEGYGAGDQVAVAAAASTGSLIPLPGLAGFFPSPEDQFVLAYAESVSAVDYFIKTYGEQTLWDLVRSYAQGQSDDDAFTTATGTDMAAFNAAWMGSLGAEVPQPRGPQPAPPGPVPSSWSVEAPASAAPASPAATTPMGSPRPRPSPTSAGDGTGTGPNRALITGVAVGVVVLIAVVGLVLLIERRPRRVAPPPGLPPGAPPGSPPGPPSGPPSGIQPPGFGPSADA